MAAEPVAVERNQIVPVMGLVDGENAQESVVKHFIDETQSSWYKVVVYSQKSADCSRFAYMFGIDRCRVEGVQSRHVRPRHGAFRRLGVY